MADSDDNLEKGKMGFLDHLDELRRRLMHTAIALVLLFFVSWFFSDRIYDFLQRPVNRALHAAYVREIEIAAHKGASITQKEGADYTYTFQIQSQVNDSVIPAGTTIPAKYVKDAAGKLSLVTAQPWIIGTVEIPEGTLLPTEQSPAGSAGFGSDEKLVIDTVAGGFNLYVRVSFYFAIFLAVPFLLYQIWAFVSPGLYKHERSYVWPVIGFGTIFFLLGAAFAYKIAFPRACDYLIGLTAGHFRPLIKADDYFNLVTTIMLGLGVVFQIPTLTFVLARVGLVTPRFILKFWRFAIVIIMVLAAILTPTPDVANMMVFAFPMVVLYFLSVGVAWLFGRERRLPKESTEALEVS